MSHEPQIISGTNLSFDHGIARNIGLNAAIVFNHIVYWLRCNALKKNPDIHENKIWMYETQKDIADFLGFMSEDDVQKAIKKLYDAGLLIKGNFNRNPIDRRQWYTTPNQLSFLSEKEFQKIFAIPPYSGMDSANMRNANRNTAESTHNIYTDKQHIEKTTTNENESVVVFSDKEKEDLYQKMLKLGLSPSTMQKAWHDKPSDIANAIECCLNPTEPIRNMNAYFTEALNKRWQPTPSKEKLAQLAEEEKKLQQKHHHKLYAEASQIVLSAKNNLKDGCGLQLNENSIMLKIENAWSPLPINDESLTMLKKYVKVNKK